MHAPLQVFLMHLFLHHRKKITFTANTKNKNNFDKQLYKLGQRSGNQYSGNQLSSLLHPSLHVIKNKHVGQTSH